MEVKKGNQKSFLWFSGKTETCFERSPPRLLVRNEAKNYKLSVNSVENEALRVHIFVRL